MAINGRVEMGLCNKLAEEIRKEIVDSLRKKGIYVRMVEVDMNPERLNVSMNIRKV